MVLSVISSSADQIIVVSEDTEVFIILLHLQQQKWNEKQFIEIAEVEISKAWVPINFLSSLTRWDSTSFLFGIGKLTAWNVFKENNDLNEGNNIKIHLK